MPTNHVIATWAYISSSLLDAVDGYTARILNQGNLSAANELFTNHMVCAIHWVLRVASYFAMENKCLLIDICAKTGFLILFFEDRSVAFYC